jgi:hypothetical protein
MPVTNEQIEATIAAVLKANPEIAAYDLEDGSLWSKCHAYVQGAFPESILSESAWEIAFRALKPKLKRIPGFVYITDEQRTWVNDTPGHVARELYRTDKTFREVFDAIALEEKERQDLLAWARVYKTMDPNEAGFRLVNEAGFKEAVDKLVDAGLI